MSRFGPSVCCTICLYGHPWPWCGGRRVSKRYRSRPEVEVSGPEFLLESFCEPLARLPVVDLSDFGQNSRRGHKEGKKRTKQEIRDERRRRRGVNYR